MSFFGGDHNQAHYVVHQRYRVSKTETSSEAKVRREKERARLTKAGIKTQTFFQFLVKDETGKLNQKKAAEARAREIWKQARVKMEVAEGCFL